MDYLKLQNGSDIRGVAIQTDNGKPVNITEPVVIAIGGAFAAWLTELYPQKDALTVSIGRDSRLSGEAIAAWLAKGLTAAGVNVLDFGLCTTPAMFMSTVLGDHKSDASVMITASHLPFERNGLKFFTPNGGLDKGDIKSILLRAQNGHFVSNLSGTVSSQNFLPVYANHLVNIIKTATGKDKPLSGLHIIVDAGNGAGGFFAPLVLEPLGAITAGSQFLEPDGTFPFHAPNPEDAAAMASITLALKACNADFGIIFDTDVDRAGAVLKDGSELNRNRLIAVLSAIILAEHPGASIVTDSITSSGLAEYISKKGGVHRRFKRGYRNVINEAIRRIAQNEQAELAIETSGHGALRENYFLDDGAYLIVKLLIELANSGSDSLSRHLSELKEPLESREFRLPLLTDDFYEYGTKVLSHLSEVAKSHDGWFVEPENYEGVRVNVGGTGWFLLRLSLHDPIMPLNIESDVLDGVAPIAHELHSILAGFEMLDTQLLKK